MLNLFLLNLFSSLNSKKSDSLHLRDALLIQYKLIFSYVILYVLSYFLISILKHCLDFYNLNL